MGADTRIIAGVRTCHTFAPGQSSPTIQPTPHFAEALGAAWSFRLMLDSADLLRWDGWSPEAREYIEASGKEVDLEKTTATYANEIIAFDRWGAERFIEQHLEGIESYQRALRGYQARLRQLGLSGDPETP
jgi:hypothetical protein